MKRLCRVLANGLIFAGASLFAADKPHAVIVVGTHHYSPQRSMPVFAQELERHGFQTTVINPKWDPEKDERGLPGLEVLKQAEVGIFFVRFLKLDDTQLGHIRQFVESGKPVVCLRTSTHAFNYPKGHKNEAMNRSFGREVFGTPYRIHLKGKTEIAPVANAAEHPLLTGVNAASWTSPGTLYLTALEPGATPILHGTGRSGKAGTRTNGFGTHELKAEMTDVVAWTWKNQWGGRVFGTSLGHTGDFAVPASLRVLVNGTFWAAGLPVPGAAPAPSSTLEKKAPPSPTAAQKAKAAQRKPHAKPGAAAPSLADVKIDSDELTVFYGNSLIERLQEEGSMEALVQLAKPGKRQQFRSLAYTGDEVGFRIRPVKFGDHLGYLARQMPADRVVMCFGMNEAFAGEAGLEAFKKNLNIYLSIVKGRHAHSEMVLVSPTAVEAFAGDRFPDADERNADVAMYTDAMKEIAGRHHVRFVDLFGPSKALYAVSTAPLTFNGLHLNEAGCQAVGRVLAGALSDPEKVAAVDTKARGFEAIRTLVSRKAYEVAMAYHPANGIHYYGVRGRSYEYAAEIPHHLHLANQLDQAIWKQAKQVGEALPFPHLATAKAEPPLRKPRKGLGLIKSGAEDLRDFTVAEGYDVNLFASSEEFPELINPLQIRFDARGRLWVACVASYPVPVPGTLSNDSILILEDTNGDGKADKKIVFADGLKLPDGFVFYQDGIIVSVARKLVWLRDTDGDGKADQEEELLRGADDTDTHHGGYLARTPQGQVIYCEGLFHRGQFETPYGPLRTKDATALHLDPVTRALRIQRQTTHPNPWKISWNSWGESIQIFGGGQIIDCEYYNVSTPVGTSSSSSMGMPFRDDKGCAIAVVSSTHFPKDWQGGVVTGHLLAKNAVLFTPLKLAGGVYVKAANSLNLVSSKNKSFRPTDLEFGLDGALYISDFYYPIIGHAQHSIRDANRDYENGRVWRVTRKGAALAKAPAIEGASLASLFGLLDHPQVAVRELVRNELERRPLAEVVAFAKGQVAAGKKNETFGLELLWLFERAKDYSQTDLLRDLLASKDIRVQRAAARSLRWWDAVLDGDAAAIAKRFLEGDDERLRIAVLSVASYLQADDIAWRNLIDNAEATANSPLAKVVSLAQLYDTPPLNPEFPLLKVAADAQLAGWIMNKGQTGGTIYVKSESSQDLVLGFRDNPYINLNLNNIPLHRATGSQHTKHGQINVTLESGVNKVEFFSALGGKPQKGKADLYLASLIGAKAEGLTFAANAAEHQGWAKAYEAVNATVTADRIFLKTVPSQLAFNVTKFTVKAGQKVQFVLENPDHMLHNIVITQPGKAAAVGEMADAMAAQDGAMAKHYIPDTEMILFSTRQIAHGERVEQPFTTPSKPGRYPYICTFPGHWRMMKGVMIVEK